jgi:trk system potassium uptake protein TrkH
MKSTTVSAVVGVMHSVLKGQTEVRFWKKRVPGERVLAAVASAGFYVSVLVLGTYLLELTEVSSTFHANLFEAASALGTVGLSLGITGSLTPLVKLTITFLMLCGRVGPLTFSTALLLGPVDSEARDEDLAV